MLDLYLDQLNKEIVQRQLELDTLTQLKKEFADLDYEIDRWQHRRFKSALVNTLATNFDINHSCGCCHDAVLYIRPYIERTINNNTLKVYSNPLTFSVGSKAYGGGYRVKLAWAEPMKKANIPENIIQKIGSFLDDNKDDCAYEDNDEF